MGMFLFVLVPAALLEAAPSPQARTPDRPPPPPSWDPIGFAAPTERSAESARAPSSLHAVPTLDPMINIMWHGSPTFRRQCARLAAESVRVDIIVDPLLDSRRSQATTSIRVEKGRVVSAYVRLTVARAEYLAHEIEHILEVADGVDVRWAAASGLRGVAKVGSAVFETARAIATGRLVAGELGEPGR